MSVANKHKDMLEAKKREEGIVLSFAVGFYHVKGKATRHLPSVYLHLESVYSSDILSGNTVSQHSYQFDQSHEASFCFLFVSVLIVAAVITVLETTSSSYS